MGCKLKKTFVELFKGHGFKTHSDVFTKKLEKYVSQPHVFVCLYFLTAREAATALLWVTATTISFATVVAFQKVTPQRWTILRIIWCHTSPRSPLSRRNKFEADWPLRSTLKTNDRQFHALPDSQDGGQLPIVQLTIKWHSVCNIIKLNHIIFKSIACTRKQLNMSRRWFIFDEVKEEMWWACK